jgi:signal transduction histidine kinase
LNFGSREHYRELLAGVATDLLRFADPERLVGSIFERCTARLDIDLCFSHLATDGLLDAVFIGGLTPELHLKVKTLRLGEGVLGTAAQTRRVLRCEGISADNDPATDFLRSIGVDCFCCYPLLSNGKLLGTLSFGTRKRPSFESEEFEVQQAIADQVAVAFDRIFLLRALAQNNTQLLSANADLKRAHAELEQIAFSASHDLREPVRHLNIYTELLRRQLESELTGDAARYMQFVLTNAKRVDLLVSDLLKYTGVAHEAPVSRVLDSNVVAERVCMRLRPLIEQTGTSVHVEELPAVLMAEDDLEALFENLIENAIVHHRSGVLPEIKIFARNAADGYVIYVKDNGEGIDPQHRDRIFGLFKRLDPQRDRSSTGVGLSLCRKIVERYKGEIWVESEPGQGASFCFKLHTDSQARSLAAHSAL